MLRSRDDENPGRAAVGPGDPAFLAARSVLAEGLHGLRDNEPGAGRGDVKGVHQLRTTTRRLRTTLDLFGGLLGLSDADALAADLKWLAGLLGAVRDLDVLTERFQSAADEGGWAVPLEPLFASFRLRHAAASKALQEALRSDRYVGLVARLAGSLGAPPKGDAADEPCQTALPALVRGFWKRLRRAGRALTPDSPDANFHEVRKRAKQARYAAEAVADALAPGPGSDAARFAHLARAVQDVLGAHQDAVIAAAEVSNLAAAHPDLGPFNFAAGQLIERQHRAADDSRAESFDVWDRLDRKKVVHWLKP